MVPRLPERALIRLRYHQQPSPATITPTETGIRITLDTPAALSAPGQIAAVYDPAGRILAGGSSRNFSKGLRTTVTFPGADGRVPGAAWVPVYQGRTGLPGEDT